MLTIWTQKKNKIHDPLPITAIDANSVTFTGRRRLDGGLRENISGTIDRITGKIDAHETLLWRPGTMRTFTWDLQCTPTKPFVLGYSTVIDNLQFRSTSW
jgi:hypothetical protein